MSVTFNLPNFQVSTPGEQRLYSYLYQTVQQLNWAMEHIGTVSGEGGSGNAVLTGQTSGAAASAPVSQETFSQIKGLIIKSADIVNAYCEAIQAKLQGQYAVQSEFGSFVRDTELALEASSEAVTQNYSNLQQLQVQSGALSDRVSSVHTQVETVQSGLQQVQSQTGQNQAALSGLQETVSDLRAVQLETNAYIKTGVIAAEPDGTPIYGLEIGQTNEVGGQEVFNKYARFSSSRLSFYDQNDTEVAYISDYKLYITNVQITGVLTAGSYTLDTSDGLAFRFTGGDL